MCRRVRSDRPWLALQVTGTPKALREYTLQGQTATAGLNGCWKVFTAKAKKEGGAHLPLRAYSTQYHLTTALQLVISIR